MFLTSQRQFEHISNKEIKVIKNNIISDIINENQLGNIDFEFLRETAIEIPFDMPQFDNPTMVALDIRFYNDQNGEVLVRLYKCKLPENAPSLNRIKRESTVGEKNALWYDQCLALNKDEYIELIRDLDYREGGSMEGRFPTYRIALVEGMMSQMFCESLCEQDIIGKLVALNQNVQYENCKSFDDVYSFDDEFEAKELEPALTINNNKTPLFFIDNFNNRIIGQEHSKQQLAIALSTYELSLKNPEVKKANVLITGPTGTGKTEFIRVIKDTCPDYTVVSTSANRLSPASYVGTRIEDVIDSVISQAGGVEKMKGKGVVLFLDEFDKLVKNDNKGKKAVLEELLVIIEGGSLTHKIVVKSENKNKRDTEQAIQIDTSNWLVICAGAFQGINEIIQKRLGSEYQEGSFYEPMLCDLIEYGLTPEILGRFAVIAHQKPHTKESLMAILANSENATMKRAIEYFSSFNVKITPTESFKERIVERAIKLETGARALASILEEELLPYKLTVGASKEVVLK